MKPRIKLEGTSSEVQMLGMPMVVAVVAGAGEGRTWRPCPLLSWLLRAYAVLEKTQTVQTPGGSSMSCL